MSEGHEDGARVLAVYQSHIDLLPYWRVVKRSEKTGLNRSFTKSDHPVLAVISDGPYGFQHVNVADQRRDPNSLLNWMERIIRMRKEVPEIGWGDFSFISAGSPEVLAMQYSWRNNSVLCVHNLSGEPRDVRFSIQSKEKKCMLANLLSDDHSQPGPDGRHSMLLEP